MEEEKESLYYLLYLFFFLFSFLSFRKFHTEDFSVAPESVLPLFSLWLTRSSSAVSQTEHLQEGNAEGTRLPAHYTLLSIEQKRSHSHNIFCIAGNFLKFPVINLPNSIFCGLIHLASQQRFQQIWQLPTTLFSHDLPLQPHTQCGSFLSPSCFFFPLTKSQRISILIQQVSSEIIFNGKIQI